MMKLLKTVSIAAAVTSCSSIAQAGSPYAYQTDAELAMVEPAKRPTPQAGLLTAGDYDDVLNPYLYKAYVDKMLQGSLSGKDLPYVDAARRIDIRVVDYAGQTFPLADISLNKESGEQKLALRTAANGMSYLYPNYDALEYGDTLSVTAKGGQLIEQTLTQDLIQNGGTMKFDLQSPRISINKLDLLLTIDATGSMGDEMKYLQTELDSIVSRVKQAHPAIDIHHSLIVYRDTGDAYVVKAFPFTDDINSFKTSLSKQTAAGGGDTPEAMHSALEKALELDWREDALKINFLVADAPPHDKHISDTWEAGLISRSKGVHMVPIASSGVDKTAEFLMRGMAQMTNGRYVFLTDDSGIGNPHAEPSVDCYIVTRLDGLMTRILNSLISGERQEPSAIEIIRSVGTYQSGVCATDIQ